MEEMGEGGGASERGAGREAGEGTREGGRGREGREGGKGRAAGGQAGAQGIAAALAPLTRLTQLRRRVGGGGTLFDAAYLAAFARCGWAGVDCMIPAEWSGRQGAAAGCTLAGTRREAPRRGAGGWAPCRRGC